MLIFPVLLIKGQKGITAFPNQSNSVSNSNYDFVFKHNWLTSLSCALGDNNQVQNLKSYPRKRRNCSHFFCFWSIRDNATIPRPTVCICLPSADVKREYRRIDITCEHTIRLQGSSQTLFHSAAPSTCMAQRCMWCTVYVIIVLLLYYILLQQRFNVVFCVEYA